MRIILVIRNWNLFVIWNLLFVILSSFSLRRREKLVIRIYQIYII